MTGMKVLLTAIALIDVWADQGSMSEMGIFRLLTDSFRIADHPRTGASQSRMGSRLSKKLMKKNPCGVPFLTPHGLTSPIVACGHA